MPSTLLSDATPDEQLLQQVAVGNQEAFVLLFRRRRAGVYRFALHMTASTATAEDVTQEVFMAVIRDAGRYDPTRATVMAWLCGIARNHVRRWLERDGGLESIADTDEVSNPGETAMRSDPLADLTRAERIETVRRAVLSLPVRYREAVVLCDLQELSYAEAADALDCAVGTVRSRLHRGRTLLADKLRGSQCHDENVRLGGARCLA